MTVMKKLLISSIVGLLLLSVFVHCKEFSWRIFQKSRGFGGEVKLQQEKYWTFRLKVSNIAVLKNNCFEVYGKVRF